MSGNEPDRNEEDMMLAQPNGGPVLLSPSTTSGGIEDQLAHVIQSARDVAVVAEELLRELSAQHGSDAPPGIRSTPHAIVLAPRLLSATQQQLESLLAMLRTL
jgi:hypothetical protein